MVSIEKASKTSKNCNHCEKTLNKNELQLKNKKQIYHLDCIPDSLLINLDLDAFKTQLKNASDESFVEEWFKNKKKNIADEEHDDEVTDTEVYFGSDNNEIESEVEEIKTLASESDNEFEEEKPVAEFKRNPNLVQVRRSERIASKPLVCYHNMCV